jgi:hypothetical protein
MPRFVQTLELHTTVARRVVRRYGINPRRIVARLDEQAVFVVGSPRSGTSFTARSIGDVPGFADLGEVNALKANIAPLSRMPPREAGRRIRRLLALSQRLGMVGGLRPIEQTPESSYIIPAIAEAYPRAQFVLLIRDGRDVVCSLIERGWLRDGGPGVQARATGLTVDDAGKPFGDYARSWVEPERTDEFAAVSEARRAAWAWRRYSEAALDHTAGLGPDRVVHVRYERLAAAPSLVAADLAGFLGATDRAADLAAALSRAHDASVGRWRDDLTPDQLRDVETEAGELLSRLGYTPADGET